MKKGMMMTICVLMSVSLIGCSTVKGIGQDIASVGKVISASSDHVKVNSKTYIVLLRKQPELRLSIL